MLQTQTESSPASSSKLEAAVAALDPVLALMSLVHLTGDRSLLHRYGPALEGTQQFAREEFFVVDDSEPERRPADPRVVAEIRQRLIEQLRRNPVPLLTQPDPALFREMSRLCLGIDLPDTALEVGFQHAGFTTDSRRRMPTRVPPADFKVLVVGAGMVGINAAIKLKLSGFDYTVIESRDEIGGTWSINTYPGAAVDTPSIQYSYSFDLNPSWTKYYPNGPEYLAYLRRVVERHGIGDHIHFNTAMTGATWDEARQLWVVQTLHDGVPRTYEGHALIVAVGPLNRPRLPAIENFEAFQGPVMHSSQWDSTVDLAGKRVVLVGTGCSGVQIAAAVAGSVDKLSIVQRQPEYVIPNDQVLRPVDELERWALEHIPYVAQWKRMQSMSSLLSLPKGKGMLTIDRKWREQTGGVSQMNDALRKRSLDYLARHFPDRPDLVAKLTPTYPIFAKRVILDCGFYATLKKPNVELIEGALAAFEKDAVVLADGTRIPCDVVVLATGFYLDFGTQFDIRGRGRTLREAFDPYPYAYQGMLVPGFPNLFITTGPNSHLGATHSALGEQHVHYIMEVLQMMVDEGITAMEVSEAACREYNARVEKWLERTVWVNKGEAHGYYRHDSGRVVLANPRHNNDVWHDLRSPARDHFVISRPVELAETVEPAAVSA